MFWSKKKSKEMESIRINKKKYKISEKIKGRLIYQVVSKKGKELPCFCYSEPLSVAGNCRMCLVEVEGSPKLVASCAVPVSDKMSIVTESLRVGKARESILELLLINHPLDCPVCDQGGECDLQDLTFKYGSDRGRYYEYTKRAFIDKYAGVFIKTIMTRCIHCTRCIRFFSEIIGNKDFGIFGRGENSEVTLQNSLLDPLSGNVVDVCPVGALTSKPYAFSARPWELTTIESIDIFDSMGSNIRIDLSINKVLRILPIYNKNLNKDWITNKIRYFFDILNYQRLSYPFIFLNNKLKKISWKKSILYFLALFFLKLFDNKRILYSSNFLSLNTGNIVNKFFNFFGIFSVGGDCKNYYDFRSLYIFNNNLDIFLKDYNFIFFGVNLRLEMPLLNTRLRNKKIKNRKLFYFGKYDYDVTLKIFNCGNTLLHFLKFLKGRNKNIWFKNIEKFYKEIKFYFLLNNKFFTNNSNFVSCIIKFFINNSWNFSFLNFTFGDINRKELGFYSEKIYFNNSLNIISNKDLSNLLKSNVNIYFGSFYNNFLKNLDLVLPIKLLYEDDQVLLNILGEKKIINSILKVNESIKSELDIFKIILWFFNKFNKTMFNYFPKKILLFFRTFFESSDLNLLNVDFLNYKLNLNFKTEVFLKNKIINRNLLNYYGYDFFLKNSKNLNKAFLSSSKNIKVF